MLFVLGGQNSGKTSLLMAILKQMVIDIKPRPLFKYKGDFHLIDRTQFIINGSILENIAISKPYDRKKMSRVLKLCLFDSLLDSDGEVLEEKIIMELEEDYSDIDPLFGLKI